MSDVLDGITMDATRSRLTPHLLELGAELAEFLK